MATQEDYDYWCERRVLVRRAILRMSEDLETLSYSENDRSEELRRLGEMRDEEKYLDGKINTHRSNGNVVQVVPID